MVFTCELGQANACLKKLRIVLEYEAPYKSLYCSRACSIGEADTVTITGGAHSLKRVTRYKQDGTFESLAKLNYGRFEHACGHFSRSDGSVVCFELCRECWYLHSFCRCMWWRVVSIGWRVVSIGMVEHWNIPRSWRRTGAAPGSWWPACPRQEVESEAWD